VVQRCYRPDGAAILGDFRQSRPFIRQEATLDMDRSGELFEKTSTTSTASADRPASPNAATKQHRASGSATPGVARADSPPLDHPFRSARRERRRDLPQIGRRVPGRTLRVAPAVPVVANQKANVLQPPMRPVLRILEEPRREIIRPRPGAVPL
jgi:hypothetical protein